MDDIQEIVKSQERWENTTLKSWLEKVPEMERYSRVPTQRLYTPKDRVDSDYLRDIGFPGEYPFIRGLNPTEYRSRLWLMRQIGAFGTPEDTNKLTKLLMSKRIGQQQMVLRFDLPTELGYDPDNPMAEGEVGVVGVSMPSLKEMEVLFDGIPMDEVSVRGMGAHVCIIEWAMVLAVAKKQGVSLDKVIISGGGDALVEFICRGNYVFPIEAIERLHMDMTEYSLKYIPKTSFGLGSDYPIGEAGANMVQAVAIGLACAFRGIDLILERGFSIDDIAPRGGFGAHIGLDFFSEIAKFRALRRLWARIMKERYGAKNPSSLHFRFGPGTAGSLLTAQQPENNIARTTIAALAAILAGAHSLQVSSFDEALSIPTERSVSIALATQQIIAYETGITDVVDPLGGSYYVEALTDKIEGEILDCLKQIEAQGGIVKAIESGWVNREILRSSVLRQKEIDSGERIVVGVNKFVSDEKPSYEIHRSNPAIEEEMKRRVKKLREERDNSAVQRSLKKLQKAAQGKDNLTPFVIDAVESYATIEEVTNALVAVFGRWRRPSIL